MAVTDRSALADIQPRIWMLANGGPGYPGRLLVSRRPDVNQNGWFYTALSGLDMGLDAVSWTEGSTQRQRVFYVMNDGIYMLPFDNDTQGTPVQINVAARVAGYTPRGTDLAVVTYTSGSTRLMAVASGATIGAETGHICLFESSDLGATWWWSCSTDHPLPSSNHDIVGVVANGTSVAEFYFQNTFATLSRSRRTGTNSWILHEEITVPTFIGASLVAMPTQASIPGQIELGVIGGNNTVYTSRISPLSTAPSWLAHPALPNGVLPYASKVTFGGIPFHGTNGSTPYDREKIWVIGGNLGIYQHKTVNQTGDWDAAGWTGPFQSASGSVVSIGTITATTGDPGRQPRVFGAVGYPASTLQEFPGAATFKDYVKLQVPPIAVGNSGIAIAETSSAANTSLAIATGIDRNYTGPTSPWKIRLRSSSDGGNTFDTNDSTIQPFTGGMGGGNWYVSDPTVSVSMTPGLLHHALTDVAYPDGCTFPDSAKGTRISYRRGTSAAAIAALSTQGSNAYLIDDVGANVLDHPWLVTTTDVSGTTAHVVYWGGNGASCMTNGCYWRLAPNTPSCQTNTDCPTGVLCDLRAHLCALSRNTQIVGPPRAIVGPNNEVYAFGGDTLPGWANICTLKNAFGGGVRSGDCATLGGGVTPEPTGVPGGYVYLGPALSQWPVSQSQMACAPQGGKLYKCFNYDALRSAAADPITPYKVYVAYVAGSPPAGFSPGIYFTHSTGGAGFGSFTTPGVPIATNSTNLVYYDPQVTVDADGTILVLYTAIATAPGDMSGSATVYVKMSTDHGSTFTGPYTLAAWNASTIQFHCGRGAYFYGDFMAGNVFGTRAFLNYPYGGSTSAPYVYHTSWSNQWNVY